MEWPDDLPKSPTGRVPQWVIDEAAGKSRTPDPWRAAELPLEFDSRPAHKSHTPRRQSLVTVAVLLGLAAAPRLLDSSFAQRWLPQTSTPAVVASATAGDSNITMVNSGGDGPTADVGSNPTRLLPIVAGGAGNFALMDNGSDGVTGARWSPCRAIAIVVNTSKAPKGFYAAVIDVAAELQSLTGLQIGVEGTSAEPASTSRSAFKPNDYGDRWAPLLVAWADDQTIPALSGDTVGLGSPQSVGFEGGQYFYVSGDVILDLAMAAETMSDGSRTYVAILRHELGHALGLDHVDDPTQLMAPRLSDVSDFSDGDRAGLAYLGAGPCSIGI